MAKNDKRFDFSPEARYGANPEKNDRSFMDAVLNDEIPVPQRKSKIKQSYVFDDEDGAADKAAAEAGG